MPAAGVVTEMMEQHDEDAKTVLAADAQLTNCKACVLCLCHPSIQSTTSDIATMHESWIVATNLLIVSLPLSCNQDDKLGLMALSNGFYSML